MEQPRVERVFRLMRLMTGNVYFTVEELAEKLDTSYRPEGGNWFRGHGEVHSENYKDGQMKKKPNSHSSLIPPLPSLYSQSAIPGSTAHSYIPYLCHPSFHQFIPLPSIPTVPNTHML